MVSLRIFMSSKSAKRRNIIVLSQCRRITGVQDKKREVFAAVAWRLGVEWKETAEHGYELCYQLVKEEPPPPKAKTIRFVPAKRGSQFAKDEFLQSYEWRRLRMEVLVERGARCECCGADPKKHDGVRINVDHIKPRKLFPELAREKSNLQILCDVCNHGKGNWNQTDWRTA